MAADGDGGDSAGGAPSGGAGTSLNGTVAIPTHIAMIMDGNGRWARERNLDRSAGHRAGVRTVRTIVEECVRVGVRYLTLFSFSTENWHRSRNEVSNLMSLFKEYLESEMNNPELLRNGVRLRTIGDTGRLSLPIRTILNQVEERTRTNSRLDLILAVSYGGREDMARAARLIAEQVERGELSAKQVDVECVRKHLWTADIPDPDLLIRTGGEMRISNFLLWQLAYTELVVLDVFWPDFSAEVFGRCLSEFSRRERRFGLTSAQIQEAREGGTLTDRR